MKHTRPLAVRLPLLLLTVACFIFSDVCSAQFTYYTDIGYIGSAYFWDVVLGGGSSRPTTLTAAFTQDIGAAISSNATLDDVTLTRNTTTLFNTYQYTTATALSTTSPPVALSNPLVEATTPLDELFSNTVEYLSDPFGGVFSGNVVDMMIFNAELPTVDSYLATWKSGVLITYKNLFPDSVYAVVPLLPNPNGNVFPELNTTVIEWIDCEQTVAISGYYVAWSDALMNDGVRAVIEAVIIDAVRRVLEIYTVNLTVDVISIGAQLPSIKRTSFGNGAGGLVVSLHIAQGMTELSQFAYTADQTASVLTLLNLTILDGIYAMIPSAGPYPLPLFVVAARVDGPRYGLQCDSVCKGMILLALVCVFIMIVVGVVVLVYQLCECGRVDDKEGSHEPADMSLDHEPSDVSLDHEPAEVSVGHESAEVSVGDDVHSPVS